MRKIKKINWPSDREFAMTLAPLAKVCYFLGVFSYGNKKLYAAREFEAQMKPNLWNPMFYVVYMLIVLILFVSNVVLSVSKSFTDAYEIFTTSRATLPFDEKYVQESEEVEHA